MVNMRATSTSQRNHRMSEIVRLAVAIAVITSWCTFRGKCDNDKTFTHHSINNYFFLVFNNSISYRTTHVQNLKIQTYSQIFKGPYVLIWILM